MSILSQYVAFCCVCFSVASCLDESCCRTPDATTLDCSSCNLEAIPHFQDANVRSLYLTNNSIRYITDYAFVNLTSLELLSLRFNPLVLVENDSFAGLENLHTLDLYQKNRYSISERTFEPLIALNTLKLGNICGRRCTLPYKPFSVISSGLKRLELSVPPQFVFGEHFAHLQSLESLILMGDNCVIRQIKRETFTVFAKSLKTLQIYRCRVRKLDENFLDGFEKLETLNVACNSRLNLNELFSAVKNMPSASLDTIVADGARNITFARLGPQWFNSTQFHNLRRLSLRKANIVAIDSPAFSGTLPKLEYFNGGFNTILQPVYHNLTTLIREGRHLSLTSLDLTYLGLKSLSGLIFRETYCNKDDINTEAFFRRPPPCIQGPALISQLNRTSQSIPANNKPEFSSPDTIPPSLLYIYLSNLAFSHLLFNSYQTFDYDNNILYLDISGVTLKRMTGLVQGVMKLQGVDVSGCTLTFVNPGILDSLPALRYLNLSNNELSGTTWDRLFRNSHQLEILDMRSNRLKDIPENTFVNMNSLRSVFLSHNSLGKIYFTIRNSPNLTFLDLRHNSLIMTNKFMQELDNFYLKYNNGLVVKLFGNLFQCDCNSLGFMKWLRETRINIVDKDNLLCDYKLDNKRYMISELNIDELDYYCNRMKIVAVSVTPLVTVVLVLLLIILIHRYRWTLRWKFYLLRRNLNYLSWRRNKYGPDGATELVQLQATDAFVSYNHSVDYEWVRNDLLPKVEEQWGFKLIVGQRDFRAGIPIAENICNAIDNCRCVILVITPAFAASEWCEFEMHMALVKGIRHMIIVYKEEVDLEGTSKTMRAILSSVNYIEYSETKVGNELFWRRLKDALTKTNKKLI